MYTYTDIYWPFFLLSSAHVTRSLGTRGYGNKQVNTCPFWGRMNIHPQLLAILAAKIHCARSLLKAMLTCQRWSKTNVWLLIFDWTSQHALCRANSRLCSCYPQAWWKDSCELGWLGSYFWCRANGLVLPSGKHTKNYGKSPCLMGKSTISIAIFNSKLVVYQRVTVLIGAWLPLLSMYFLLF